MQWAALFSVLSVAVADIGDIGLPLVEAADLHSSEPQTLRMMTPAADSLIQNVSAGGKYQMTIQTQLTPRRQLGHGDICDQLALIC